MSLTEEVVKGSEFAVQADAGCTPKLARKRSVANDCGNRVVEILTKRTPGFCQSSSSSSSWLHAVKKPSGAAKRVVENRKKVCSLQLPFDAEPFSKFMKYAAGHPSADSMHMVICGNQNGAKSPYCEKTSSSAYLQVSRFTLLM